MTSLISPSSFRDQILRHAPYNFGNPILPLLIGIRHFYLAPWQAYYRGRASRAGRRYRQILDERVKGISHACVSIEKI